MLLGDDPSYGTGIGAPFGDPAMNQELSIALSTGDRRTNETDYPHTGVVERRDRLFDRLHVNIRISNDPAAANQPLACFELWLDQQYPIGALSPESAHLPSNERQRDEGEIGNHDIERCANRNGIGMTDVRSFHDNNPGIAADPMVKLTISNIESDYFGGSALEKAIGEPSGRCTDVDRDATLDRHVEGLDRAVELRPGAADELSGRANDPEWILRGDQRRRLRRRVSAHSHAPGVDHPAGLRA